MIYHINQSYQNKKNCYCNINNISKTLLGFLVKQQVNTILQIFPIYLCITHLSHTVLNSAV